MGTNSDFKITFGFVGYKNIYQDLLSPKNGL